MLTVIERKVLGALILMGNEHGEVVNPRYAKIAEKMGYKNSGGVIPLAIQLLEFKNYIVILRNEKGKVIKTTL